MLSLIAGATVGVMPFSNGIEPILVRVPRRYNGVNSEGRCVTGRPTFEDYIEGLGKICDEFDRPSTEAIAILNMALYFPPLWFAREATDDNDLLPGQTTVIYSDGFQNRMRQLLQDVVNKGVLPVTGSGNNRAVWVTYLHVGWMLMKGTRTLEIYRRLACKLCSKG